MVVHKSQPSLQAALLLNAAKCSMLQHDWECAGAGDACGADRCA